MGKTQDEAKLKVVTSAYQTIETAVKSLKPGVHNGHITQVVNEVASAYETQTLEGVISHSLKRFLIDRWKVR